MSTRCIATNLGGEPCGRYSQIDGPLCYGHYRGKPWLDAKSFAEREAKKLIPQPRAPRQDSFTDQMETVLLLAKRAGCVDVHDWLLKQP